MKNTGYTCAQGHWHYSTAGVITCNRAFTRRPVGRPDPELVDALRAIVARGLGRTIERLRAQK